MLNQIRMPYFWPLFLAGMVPVCYFLFRFEISSAWMMAGILGLPILLFLLLFRRKYLLWGAILLTPLSVHMKVGPGEASFPGEILMAILGLVMAGYLLFKKLPDRRLLLHPITILLVIELGWMLFAGATGTIMGVSMKRCIMRSLFLLVYYFAISELLALKAHPLKSVFLYGLGFLPPLYFMVYMYSRFAFDPRVSSVVAQPYYNDHTIVGAVLAFILPAFILMGLGKIRVPQVGKTILGLLCLLLAAGEILSFSRAALLSLFVAGGVYLLIRIQARPWHLALMLFIVSAAAFIGKDTLLNTLEDNKSVSHSDDLAGHYSSVTNISTDASNKERINRWVCAWRMFLARPITGFGPGTYQFEYAAFQTMDYKTYISTNRGDRGNAHSEYLTALSETGLPGFVILLCSIFIALATGFRIIRHSRNSDEHMIATALLLGLVTFYVHGMFNSFLDQDKMAVLVFPALAALAMIDIRQKENQRLQTES